MLKRNFSILGSRIRLHWEKDKWSLPHPHPSYAKKIEAHLIHEHTNTILMYWNFINALDLKLQLNKGHIVRR